MRQDDPLSRMLFVVAMEWLTILLEHAEIEGKLKGLGRNGPTVIHIFFKDDVMFYKACIQSIGKIEEVLDLFSKASGLQDNMKKSKIIFSKSVLKAVRRSGFKKGASR